MPAAVPVLLMVQELGVGGTERQTAETARALDRSLFEPHVACFRPGGFRARELEAAGVPVTQFAVSSFASPSLCKAAMQMGRYLKQHKIRLVHTFDAPANLFGIPVARLYRTPVVLASQRAHRALTPGFRRRMLRITGGMADGIVVNAKAVERELIAEEGTPPGKIHLCYNGIDTEAFHPQGRSRESGVVIGVVCALRKEKGLDTLLDAFASMRAAAPEARLLIVGSGPDEDRLRRRTEELQLGGRCRFEPATTDVPQWLRTIDVFVLPSLSEALSNSLMEAMACGCCVAASTAGGNPELVEDGATGMLFPPGDAAPLSQALRRLYEDAGLRNRLAEAAAHSIAARFSLAAAGRRMGEIYQQALERLSGTSAS